MTDLTKIEKEWQSQGIRYHKICDDGGYCGIGEMKPRDREGYQHVMGYGDVKLNDYEQLFDYLEFDIDGSLVSFSDVYSEWGDWLSSDIKEGW